MTAEVAETHISVVLFMGDRAYKIKKPVALPFLDFSTREKREAACRREVELNSRLAPDVYLGLADVLGPDGAPCEHVVVMRRMPADRRLSALLPGDVDDHVRRVARVVAAFHAQAATGPDVDAAATRDAMRDKWLADLEETRAERLGTLALRYLEGRRRLFDERIAAGRARDGHGDLLADDIFCLDDGPRILDCIEFDDSLRYGDVLADVAFLAMDLERLGAPDLARRFLGWYREFSAETHPASLEHFYVAFRAHIRAKVALIRSDEQQARALLDIALQHLERARVRLVLVGGLPGTGKTTLSRALGERLAWPVLSSDEIRKDLAGVDRLAHGAHAYRSGLYSPERTEATYVEMLRRARVALERGESIVLDASWSDEARRREARAVAAETAGDLVEVRCVAPQELAAVRIRERAGDASDATAEIAARMAEGAAPWPEATVLETSGSLADAVRAALEVTRR